MSIIFLEARLHGTLQFLPTVPLAFEDERAEEYFIAAFGAQPSDKPPIHTYPVGSVVIDPKTVFAATGARVLPAVDASLASEGA
jgi:hypothetical protein